MKDIQATKSSPKNASPNNTSKNGKSHRSADSGTQEFVSQDYLQNASIALHSVNAEGIITWANATELQLLGYREDEYIGHSIKEFHKDQNVIEDILARLFRLEPVRNQEATLIHKDGSERYVLINSSPSVKDGVFDHSRCFTVDITERKNEELSLAKTQSYLQTLIDSTYFGFTIVDKEGSVLLFNQPTGERIRHSKAFKPGGSIYEIALPEYREMTIRNVRTALTGEPVELELPYTEHGISYWLKVRYTPIVGKDGKPEAVCINTLDITRNKEIEDKLVKSESLFRSVVLNIPKSAVIVIDRDHRFLLVEGDILTRLGYDRRNYEGKHPTEALPPGRYEASKDLYDRVLAGEQFSIERISEETGDTYLVHCVPLKDQSGAVYAGMFLCLDVSEAHKSEERISQSEKRFRALIEKGSDGIALCDAQGVINYLSPSTKSILGYDLEELLGRTPWEYVHPNDLAGLQQVFMSIVSQPGNTMQATWRKRHKDGTYRWLEGIGTNLLNDPAVGAIVVNFRDITERKQGGEYSARLAAIVESSDDAIISKTLEGIVTSWNSAAERIFGYTANEMIGQSITKLIPPDRLLEETIIIQRLRRGERIEHFQTKRVAKDGRVLDVALTISPIKDTHGHIVGASKIARDVTEQKRLEEALRESEKNYRQLIEGLPIAVYTTDAEGRVMLYNDEAVTLWGREPEIGHDKWCGSWKIFDMDDNPIDLDTCPMALTLKEGKAVTGTEIVIERPDGTRRNVLPHPKPVFDANGRLVGAVNTLVDITEQKLAYQRLRESEKRFRTVADHAPVMIWMAQPNKERTFFNKQWLEFTGRTLQQESGYGWADNVHPDDRERLLKAYEYALENHEELHTEYRLRRYDGEYRWVTTHAAPRYSPNKTFLGYIGAVTDITETKRAELNVRESEKRFRTVANTAPVMIWMSGTDGGCDFFNMGWLNFRGRALEDELGDGWTNGIHPDEREETVGTYKRAFDARTEFQLETRFLRHDGIYRWIVTNGVPRFDADGTFLGYIGSCVDITDRKMAAAELERQVQERTRELRLKHEQLQQQKEFVDTILDTSVDTIVVVGKQLEYLAVNRKAYEEFGKSKTEMLGRKLTAVFPQLKGSPVIDLMKKALNGEVNHLESFRSLNDRYYEMFFIPLRDNQGAIYACLSIGHDTTSVVEMTEELKQTNQVLAEKNQELNEQKEFVEKIIDSSVDVITVLDHEGRYLAVNTKTEELFKVKRDRMIGKHMLEVFPELENTETYTNLMKALSGQYVHTLMQRSVVNKRIYENFFVPLTRNGSVYACLIIGHDNTFAIEVAEKLRTTNQILEERNRELARSNSDLEQFAYIASHDLQEPLRKIRMFSGRLQETNPDQKTTPFIDKIISSSERMSDLINDLLNYSRLSHPEENFVSTNLADIAKKVINDFDIVIHEKNATVTMDKLPRVDAIPLQINQLFHNLISNSLKFTRDGVHPVIHVTSRMLTAEEIAAMKLKNDTGYCQIDISDNGIGFEQEYAEKIFVIFQRLNGKQEYKGTGIGLAICKKIVDTHHGKIFANGKEGKGAVFHIILPLTQQRRVLA